MIAGVVGDWKNYFAVAQNEKFDQIYLREMDGFDFDLLYDPAWPFDCKEDIMLKAGR